MREETPEHGRGRRAVHVVVAEDRHFFPADDRPRQSGRSRAHVGERRRIGQKLADGRVEKPLDGFGRNAAAGEHARGNLRHAMTLRDGKCRHLLAFRQPMCPGGSGGRAAHAEEEALFAAQGRSRSLWRAFISRTVREDERSTMVSVMISLPLKRTPESRLPSVTPVAAKSTSPFTRSSIL